MEYCIELEGVTKSFTKIKALDELSFKVPCGESFALLGPNGAGKSTTLRILSGLLKPDSGKVMVCNSTPDLAGDCIGYLPEDALPFLNLTVKENLEYIALLRGVRDYKSRIVELASFLHLEDLDKPAGSLSRGNRQKLAIAMTLIHRPRVLLLDEPLNYLDLPTQEEVIKYLRGLNSTMLVSTHIMSIAERLTSYVIIINKGRVIWEGRMDDLKKLSKNEERLEEVVARIMGGKI
ncbi:ABC transporter ATP-binding protein [Sulfolobus sp. E1]|uniref:ABC transporter ATP-binding protein n=1 Tax=Saccharolobus sp. A20 TaxID=1891280 RepID=UPI000845DE63|nr:ABC transporter ATP-binding protein [Sulfolobus sp. A20]TRM77683.1 ABC transporter ATP-binding protein [Sulfolobus sp. A20-N-F8]TRM79555.1 ABC transporter ATP-binding protein [Sulfolobus sp. B5]TRM83830.1 ABC transporter ATP-binding protein [Sulfolobus sp. F3]TRM86110.1 ABC transporter ATP-binding protein [Sulfolobus sp. E3]TRM97645.1 ABC transporter ATP-binding protein [Sulfolobus sp. F1]TRN03400.1 ABC transporter ATP-binding protein [Sulfolobus sp. E1]